MASRLSKLCPRILSSIAVFIFLSGSTDGQKATRCYWCGPLAEQVHRSQRSPSCDPFRQHQTVCDEGYTHCAIIASSPPYAESRLCVKLYQDECYSRYCNSTKTWRMICTCRGDLCNGNNSEREIEAFAAIARRTTIASARIKRALLSGFTSVKTKGPSENNTIIVIQNKTAHSNMNVQGDQPEELIHNTTEVKHMEDNIIIEHGTSKENHFTHKAGQESNNKHNAPTKAPIEKQHNDVKIDKPTTLEMLTKVIEITTSNADIDVATKPSTEIVVSQQKTTSNKLPPAEALQQNVTPTKVMEVTTVTEVTIAETLMTQATSTTQTNETKKNIGPRNLSKLFIFGATFLVLFCL